MPVPLWKALGLVEFTSSSPLGSGCSQGACRVGAGGPESALRVARAGVGSWTGRGPCRGPCEAGAGGSCGCTPGAGRRAREAGGWVEGRWKGEAQGEERLAGRRVGGTAWGAASYRTGAWSCRWSHQSSSWTAGSGSPRPTCRSWRWTCRPGGHSWRGAEVEGDVGGAGAAGERGPCGEVAVPVLLRPLQIQQKQRVLAQSPQPEQAWWAAACGLRVAARAEQKHGFVTCVDVAGSHRQAYGQQTWGVYHKQDYRVSWISSPSKARNPSKTGTWTVPGYTQ